MPSKFADNGKLSRHCFPTCMVLAATGLALVFAMPVSLAGTLQSLSFDKNALVITGSSLGKDAKLQSWDSEDRESQTRMIILDLPGTDLPGGADSAALDKTVDDILAANPQIHRLIVTPLADHTLRILLEIAHEANESIQPAIETTGETTGNGLRLNLTSGGEQSKATSLVAAKSNDADQLSREKSLLNEMILSNQELTKENKRLEAEKAELIQRLQKSAATKTAASPPIDPVASGKYVAIDEYQKLEDALKSLATERDDYKAQMDAMQIEINRLNGQLVTQNTRLRELVPGEDVNRVDNLQTALLQVSIKLHNAEAEIAQLKGQPAPKTLPVPGEQKTVDDTPQQKDNKPVGFFTPKPSPEDESQLEETIRNQPDQYDAYMALNTMYMADHQYKKASGVLENLLLVNPQYADAYYALSQVMLQQGKPVEAKASLETYKRLRPEDTQHIEAIEQQINAAQK